MAIQSVVDFLEATASDQVLREELVRALGVGDGDISSAANLDAQEAEALLSQKAVGACALAEARGFLFTVRELHTVVEAVRRHGDGELDEAQLAATLGLAKAPSGGVREALARAYRGVRYTKRRTIEARQPDILRFLERTATDPSVQAELKTLLEAGDGDVSDFSRLDEEELRALKTARGAIVAEFAAGLGYQFRLSELHAVLDAFQRLKQGELSTEAFAEFVSEHGSGAGVLPAIKSVAEMTYLGATYERVIPAIAQDNTLAVVRFMQATQTDEGLREKLQALIGGDGDISAPGEIDAGESEKLLGEWAEHVVALGAEAGFHFAAEDLSAVVGAFQLVEKGDLSLESCNRILGISRSVDQETVQGAAKTARRIYRGVPVS